MHAPDPYDRASTPLRSMTLSNFNAGPVGRLSPIPHYGTVETSVQHSRKHGLTHACTIANRAYLLCGSRVEFIAPYAADPCPS